MITLFLCALFLIGNACAVSVWDGNSIDTSFSGSGTKASPYQITSAAELAGFAKLVNEGNSYSRKYFLLTDDVDLQNHQWTPIGYAASTDLFQYRSKPFEGTFSGDGHVISNLYINSPDSNCLGLFGNILAAEITDVGVINVDIRGKTGVGGLVGYMHGHNMDFVKRCYSSGKVEGDSCVGGLVGCIRQDKIFDSYSTAQVSGTECVGGLVGWMNPGTITRCYATGDVSGSKSAGGIAGTVGGLSNSALLYSYLTDNVAFNQHVTGNEHVGRIAGETSKVPGANVEFCYASPNMKNGNTPLPSGKDIDKNGENLQNEIPSQKFYEDKNTLNWDFQTTWKMGEKYPILMWQPDVPRAGGDPTKASGIGLLLTGLALVIGMVSQKHIKRK